MEPFRSTVTPFGANPMPSGQAPIAGIDNPRIAAILQHLQTLPPDQIARLRETILNTPENQRGAALSQFFSSSGNPQAAQAVADVEQERADYGGFVPLNKYGGPLPMDTSNLPPGAVNLTSGTPHGVPNPRPDGGPTPGPVPGGGGGGPVPGGGGTTPPTGPPGQTGPPMMEALKNFDFSTIASKGADAYKDPTFLAAWQDVMSKIGQLKPDQRQKVEDYYKSLGTITPGEGRGLNAYIDAYNKAIGANVTAPPGTNPPPGSQGGPSDTTPPGGGTTPPAGGPTADQEAARAARRAARAQAMAARMGTVNNFDWGGVSSEDRQMPWEDFKKKYFGGLGRGRAGGAAYKAWAGQQKGAWAGGGTTSSTPDAGQNTAPQRRRGGGHPMQQDRTAY